MARKPSRKQQPCPVPPLCWGEMHANGASHSVNRDFEALRRVFAARRRDRTRHERLTGWRLLSTQDKTAKLRRTSEGTRSTEYDRPREPRRRPQS